MRPQESESTPLFCPELGNKTTKVTKKESPRAQLSGRGPAKAPHTQPQSRQTKAKSTKGRLSPRKAATLTYILGFLLIFSFFYFIYGDMITRAEQDMYISSSPDTMYYLLSQSDGRLFYVFRWVMLVCKWALAGAAFLALVMTLTAWAFDYALQIPRKLRGLGFLVGAGETGWMIFQGTNLYYKSEPSLIVLIPIALLVLCSLLALLTRLARKYAAKAPQPVDSQTKIRPWGALFPLILFIGLGWSAKTFNENAILTARFQNLAWQQDWETIIKEAHQAKQPSRAVAAYYAIALEETDQLLDGMFDIAYEFPKLKLKKHEGSEEYGLFVTDCNYHAGLLNASYRCAMDHLVMNGPRLYMYKRMAVCSLLNGEEKLCRKYLRLIAQMPFEQSFVEKYEAMLDNPELIAQDPELVHVRHLIPKEDKFEQNYQPPAFLGYNVGLYTGSDYTLITSAAACLYSKDLIRFLQRAKVMHQKRLRFPPCMQEAIAILGLRDPNILKQFPEVSQYSSQQVRSFLFDAKPYIKDRLKLRHELKERWLGTYAYYYYTENNDPEQVAKSYDPSNKVGVN